MVVKKFSKSKLAKAFFGCFFSILVLFSAFFTVPVYAEPAVNQPTTTETTTNTTTATPANNTGVTTGSTSCENSLGAIGWLVCPTTGKISEAVDWLYEKIEDILLINPVKAEDGQPIYEIWKYFRAVTNIVFIIFLLVVIYSQITGWGINNYGLKKILPKLIVTAILVNLSFLICSVAVDLSNIVGNSLRGLFESIEAATMSGMAINNGQSHIALAEMYQSMAGGTALAIGGGVIAFETGAIWMLIPVILGAIVAVVTGLITIALRQAVVVLLIMIAPLAMVAYMLPNTDRWFKQWKQLLYKMLIFYPMFSLLFGASSLAGWAIIANAQDGFSLLLGVAVQIFPLFFSWKLMKMSGTFLGAINASMHRLAAAPLATNRAWAASHRDLTRAKNLARGDAYTPSLKLRQYLENRKIARGEETTRHLTTVKNRGLAYDAKRNYKRGDLDGALNRRGQRAYEDQARGMEYQREALRHKNNMEEGLGNRTKYGSLDRVRVNALDLKNIKSADELKFEQVRTDEIALSNAEGFRNRIEDAMNAHMDAEKLYEIDENGKLVLKNNHEELKKKYREHFEGKQEEFQAALERYSSMSGIMKGDLHGVTRVASRASRELGTLEKIADTEFVEYLKMVPPTADVFNRTMELVNQDKVRNNDAILAGTKVLLQRGDTDLIKNIALKIFPNTKFEIDENGNIVADESLAKEDAFLLGTHRSQAWANFLMFDVKDADTSLRRLGKFINLETASYFSGKRKKRALSIDEYVLGSYGNVVDADGNFVMENGKPKKLSVKRRMKILQEGTSLDGIERPAMQSMREMIEYACAEKDENGDLVFDENGHLKLDTDKYVETLSDNFNGMLPAFIGAIRSAPSGSERLVGLEAFSSGIKDGKAYWNETWTDENGVERFRYSKETRDAIENMHTDLTVLKNGAKNPNQFFSTRTDEKAPDEYHLLRRYNQDPKKFGGGDGLTDKQKIKRVTQMIAYERGLIERMKAMYKRGAGASGDAKTFVTDDWLGLSDGSIDEFLKEMEARKPQDRSQKTDDGVDAGQGGPYTAEIRDLFVTEAKKLWEDWRKDTSSDKKPFYDAAMDFIEGRVGAGSMVGRKYEDFYEDISDGGAGADEMSLAERLFELLSDPDNYD